MKNISALLSAATASLLSQSLQAAPLDNLSVDATSAHYSEEKGITVVENILQLNKELDESNVVELELAYDSMTGSSPNGSVKATTLNPSSTTEQTFTTPSGETTTIPSNETPTVPYTDQRIALSASLENSFSSAYKNKINANYAWETDYQSVGVGDQVSMEFNQRMSAISLSASVNQDTISPGEGVPEGLTSISSVNRLEDQQKTIYQFSLGLSQILDRRTLVSTNIGFNQQKGYLTDPYKIISHLDSSTGNHVTDPSHYFEKRPDTRSGQSLTLKFIRQLENDMTTVRGSYEYYQDDWQIQSQAVEVKLHFKFDKGRTLEPQLRLYRQSEAEFYHYFLVNGPMPDVSRDDVATDPTQLDYASADYRLGALISRSFGIAYGQPIFSDGNIKFRVMRLEVKDQTNRFDTLSATLIQASFYWQF